MSEIHRRARTAAEEFRASFMLRTAAAGGGLVATFLTTVVAVRGLEAREAAAFLAILAGLMLGPMFGKLGLGQNVIRLISGEIDTPQRRAIIGSHLRAATVLALLSAPTISYTATLALVSQPSQLTVVILSTVLIAAETIRLLLSDIFSALGDVVGSVTTTHHVRTVVVVPALIGVVILVPHPTLINLLTVYAAVAIVLLGFAILRGRGSITILGRSQDGPLFATIVVGLVLAALDASAFLVGRGDVWLASAIFTPLDATRYSTVSMLAFQVTVITGLATLAIMPVTARMWRTREQEAAHRLLSAAATLSTAATAVVVVGIVVAGHWVLGVAYGPDFAGSYGILVVLALGGLGQAVFGFNVTLLLISGHIRRAVTTCVIVLAVIVPLAVIAATQSGPGALAVVSSVAAVALPGGLWVAARLAHLRAPLPSWRVAAALRTVRSSAPAPRSAKVIS